MVAQFRLSIGSIAFISALQVSILGIASLPGPARAEECLTAPGPSTSPNSHWYYRTDRAQQRKCWYQRGADGAPQGAAQGTAQGAAQDDSVNTTQSVSGASADSLASFKAFIAQRGLTNLSDAQVQQLYGEFLQWRRRPENVAREHQ